MNTSGHYCATHALGITKPVVTEMITEVIKINNY
jgi:hypothetical protein